MVDGIIIITLSSFLIYGLIKIQKNKNVFRKLNLQGNEIEIFEESDDSYFDKYLNEVLYLFENVDADVISIYCETIFLYQKTELSFLIILFLSSQL